jgi:hypothetical protein
MTCVCSVFLRPRSDGPVRASVFSGGVRWALLGLVLLPLRAAAAPPAVVTSPGAQVQRALHDQSDQSDQSDRSDRSDQSDRSDRSEGSERRNYYVAPRSVGTTRETEPPRYVRTLSETDWRWFEEATWLDFGLDYRMRFEYRDDDLRRPVAGADFPFLLRTRTYLGVKEKFDPFRFVIELEDARRYNSQFPLDDRDVNQHELIQSVAELYFEEGGALDRTLRIQAGRMAFEYVDRRLIARNEWRNTTNTFQGLRVIAGEQQDDWQLDLLALQPIQRRLFSPDVTISQRWFYGVVLDWRRWSEWVTLQPYYLFLDQGHTPTQPDRGIHSLALRGFGTVGETGYDYDLHAVFQVGHDGPLAHRAFGMTSELGYTFEHDWNPRLSVFMGYASGDRDPGDERSERFDRLFGFARPWSANDYYTWENLIAPKTRIEFEPHEKLAAEIGYGVFWLASDRDRWANAGLRDPLGESGSFMGHELDLRLRIRATPRVNVTLGYAHYIPGQFTRNVGRSEDSDFFYIEVSPRLLK